MTHTDALVEVHAAVAVLVEAERLRQRRLNARPILRAHLAAIGCRLDPEQFISLKRACEAEPPLILKDLPRQHAENLEAAGLVTIDREAADREGRRVTATEAGRALVGRLGG